jgi:hypothetical protein
MTQSLLLRLLLLWSSQGRRMPADSNETQCDSLALGEWLPGRRARSTHEYAVVAWLQHKRTMSTAYHY